MTITKEKESGILTLKIEGRIDTKTAPELESTLHDSQEGITGLVFDLAGVSYISSAGLRVLLMAQKQMNKKGEMRVIHASSDLMEIFEVTGFSDILRI